MSGSITQFLAEFEKRGASRASHFDVLIPILGEVGRSNLPASYLMFRCEAAEFPGRQLNSSEQKIYGPIYKTPYQNLYQETTLTFLETADLDIRYFFEEWMNLIINTSTNEVSYPDTYMQNIEVRQYDVVADRPDAPGNGGIAGGPFIEKDESGKIQRVFKENNLKKVMTCKLFDAFPTNINQMTTSWSDDSYQRVQVTFFYRYYQLIPNTIMPSDPASSIQSQTPVLVARNFSGEE